MVEGREGAGERDQVGGGGTGGSRQTREREIAVRKVQKRQSAQPINQSRCR